MLQLEAGFIGDHSELECFDPFSVALTSAFDGESLPWEPLEHFGSQFSELRANSDASFVGASSITNGDIQLSAALEDSAVRQLAIAVKRAGGLLASDKKILEAGNSTDTAEHLVNLALLAREYVVVCKQTSNQVNRLKTREALKQMAEAGLQCSCGRAIDQERVEELFVPTDSLHRMLNQSYWTTVRLVGALREVGVPDERVILNIQEGADEIDAFVDLDGTLLMFELKDNEFSMGHAYPFGGRIAQYRPDYAVIVSTKGVAPEVKEYFKRVNPDAKIVYVGDLTELEAKLVEVVTEVRVKSVVEILSALEFLAGTELPLTQLFANRMQFTVPEEKNRDRYPIFS